MIQKVDGLRSEHVVNVIWGSRGAVPEKKFRLKLIGLLEKALFIITRRNYNYHCANEDANATNDA